MATFDDLIFEERFSGTKDAKMFFPNGYGASVIQGLLAQTSNDSEYELAVLKGKPHNWDLCYDTPIADDIIGHITADKVTKLLQQIENLEPIAA